ncbi:hypothetical protein [Trichococcus ilyis]|uniref:Rho termination factor N-terminal domain-containing protein n=1 Tax=Trichococcus ilyis TaxID=640938 RepID=A0A143YMM1_9LACT|nr:hypothetical protein [Trichococcus ilyis]CZQ92060.1 Hypothetical protein TR210_1023 [Trichococcus ilyis]SEI77503.1 hypothetical protein SAMN05216375_103154 [Trichococcus ilyis]
MNTNNVEKQNSHLDLHDKTVREIFELYKEHAEVPYISDKRDKESWLNAVHIGSEQLVPKRNMIRFEEDILPGHLILLWRIQFGTFTSESVYPKYFEYNYGINGPQALAEVMEKGYAVELSAADSLDHLNAASLKAILKHYGVAGYSKMKKPELMALAKQELSEEQLDSQVAVRGYRITPAGEAVLAKHPEVVDRHPKKNY